MFLGHIVTKDGISADPAKVEVIVNDTNIASLFMHVKLVWYDIGKLWRITNLLFICSARHYPVLNYQYFKVVMTKLLMRELWLL